MTRDDFIGQLEGYLDEYQGITPLPEAIRIAVRAQLPATMQLRPLGGLLRRLPIMNNNIVRFGIAAAVVVLVTLLGIRFLPGNTGNDASPTPVATSTPIPSQGRNDSAGVYTIHPLPTPNRGFSVTYLQPDGWSVVRLGCLVPTTGETAPEGMGICFFAPTSVHKDPCHADTSSVGEIEVGPTVDDLAAALVAQTAYEATTPTDITLGGYSGKRLDLQLPDSDFATCEGGFVPWHGSISAQGPGNRWHLWILDVDGLRVVIVAHDFPGTPPQDQEELYGIVESFQIEIGEQLFLGWPGPRENPPGRYSWDGVPEWMHNGYQTLEEGQGVEITFAHTSAADPDATPVIVAGYPGTYEELVHEDGSRTERWTMEIEGRTLEVTIEAEPNTTAAQLAEAYAIIESIRYEPPESGEFRVTFTLPAGWDSG